MGIPDARSTGRSRIVPYIEGESPMDRHNRRLGINLNNLPVVQGWCAENGFTLTIHNEGDHWTMEGHGGVVEWWPRSAKLVFNRNWHQGIHCYDYEQMIREVAAHSWVSKSNDQPLPDDQSAVQGWCAENGFTLTIHNHGNHWIMKGHGEVAEWWPSSWKLVFNREWGRSICCLKYDELIRHLTRYSWAFKKDGDSK